MTWHRVFESSLWYLQKREGERPIAMVYRWSGSDGGWLAQYGDEQCTGPYRSLDSAQSAIEARMNADNR